VFKQAVRINAKFMVMAHQHPSGDPTPSRDDFITTTRIVNAGKILGIEVLDHVIIGSNGRYYSFSDNGTL
jgi:DNA repair protein RadC